METPKGASPTLGLPRRPPLRGRVPGAESLVDSTDFDEPDIGLAGNIERFVETPVMSRAQPKSSPTDQHARRIGSAIAKGRRPALTPDLDLYLESARTKSLPPSRAWLAICLQRARMRRLPLAICFCCRGLHLRSRTDRGYADAARLIADFQSEVAAQVGAGHIDGHVLAHLGGALHQSKIPASPELTAASAGQRVDDDESGPFPADIRAPSTVSSKSVMAIPLSLSARL
jgi:hypothetical protein